MNAFSFTQRTTARIFAAVALFSLIAGLVPMQAFAGRDHDDDHDNNNNNSKVRICHASENGYSNGKQEVDKSAVLSGKNAHKNHSDGGFNDIGDIIPPFTSGNTNYPGKNWNVEGQAIWNADCKTKGDVTVTKVVSGGTAVVANFALKVGNTAVVSGVKKTGVTLGNYKVTETGPTTNYTASFSGACDSDGDITIIPGQSVSCTITNTYVPPVTGCTDPNAFNYNPNATQSNDSCVAKIFGCTDQEANNYSEAANTDDNSCDYDVLGCMNPTATNYNPNANIDNDSCEFPAVPGCTDPNAFNYNPNATEDDASCTPKIFGCTDDAALNYNSSANVDNESCEYEILGCTDSEANNYNVNATSGNSEAESCSYDPEVVLGCTDPEAINYNSLATQGNSEATNCSYDDGGPDPIYGCTDETANNYDPEATNDDESCTYGYLSQCHVEAQNLLVNGSFEDSVGLTSGNWGIFTSVNGWIHSLSTGLEIWNNLLITPSHGVQNAELDGEDATKITQTVNGLIPGAIYELSFDFAARDADAADNHIEAAADGVSLVNESTNNTDWLRYGATFTSDGSTDISFVDLGTVQEGPGGTGTLLDNAKLCLVRTPVDEEETLYRIHGYSWHDDNRNANWDGTEDEEEGNEEGRLEGFTIRITNNDGDNRETTTDENGYYYFDVPAGTWVITAAEEGHWFRTTQESFTVTVPVVPPPMEVTFLDSIMNFIIPVAYAQVMIDTYGDFNFGNDERSAGGGGGGSTSDDEPDGEVLGDSDDADDAEDTEVEDSPEGAVLGEQVDAVPAGAPDAGAGGTSHGLEFFHVAPVAMVGRTRKHG